LTVAAVRAYRAVVLSLFIHAALGATTVALFYWFNAHLYRDDWPGSRTTLLEGLYYAFAAVSVCIGWWFNVHYVMEFPAEASWMHFTKMLFANPAGASGGQDLIITNVFLFPLWTMIDGPRRGLRRTWIYFAMSLVTSFGCAMGLYLAAQERQVRWNAAHRA
jgi:hypothetical protein